ncbi:MAG TPA: hypothetical protein PLP25_09600 [Candidatus Limiplasma sp.]|nr:hypothetical protein [Candidatus Limiplasma sp.]HPS82095.1 hypothetical protein [Candidatus Limiplasma sp.]
MTAVDVAIGFDTSCYTTSVAAVDANGKVIAFQRMLLPVQSGQRGLRQSEAVFAHIRQLPALAEKAGQELEGARIVAVAASDAPREDEASYMPVFTVGLGHARSLASFLKVPCYRFSHQQGHIAAGLLGQPPLGNRFVAMHLSGGTTELLLSDGGSLTRLGGSLDLHAGQLIDRVGVALGLPFPAGPALERLAVAYAGLPEALIPASMAHGDLDCHLSGAETRCQQWIREGTMESGQMAAEVFDLLARTVARMLAAACRETQTDQALVVGGVASSTLLRTWVVKRMQKLGSLAQPRFGQPTYSADNAAGIAWLGVRKYESESAQSR